MLRHMRVYALRKRFICHFSTIGQRVAMINELNYFMYM